MVFNKHILPSMLVNSEHSLTLLLYYSWGHHGRDLW